jgi:hypothetical protein
MPPIVEFVSQVVPYGLFWIGVGVMALYIASRYR